MCFINIYIWQSFACISGTPLEWVLLIKKKRTRAIAQLNSIDLDLTLISFFSCITAVLFYMTVNNWRATICLECKKRFHPLQTLADTANTLRLRTQMTVLVLATLWHSVCTEARSKFKLPKTAVQQYGTKSQVYDVCVCVYHRQLTAPFCCQNDAQRWNRQLTIISFSQRFRHTGKHSFLYKKNRFFLFADKNQLILSKL